MSKIKKYLLVVCCLLMAVFLGGCTSKPLQVDTVLTVDQDFSGERRMTITLTAREFKGLFKSDLEALKTLLNDNCPKDMTAQAVAGEKGSVEISMTIPFVSHTEYYDKIRKIFSNSSSYDAENMPTTYYEYSDSLLKKGVTREENFASKDLVFWLLDVLSQDIPQIQGKSLDEVFISGITILNFNGEEIACDEQICYSTMEASALDHLSVETTLNDAGSYDAVINFYAGTSVVSQMGDKLSSLLGALVPEGGSFASEKNDTGMVYTNSFSAVSASDYVDKMNKALHSTDTVFKVTQESGEGDTLQATKKIVAYLDASYFLDFSNEASTMEYILKASPEHSFENCESVNGYIQSYSFEDNEDWCSTTVSVRPSDEITVTLGYTVDIDKIEVTTRMKSIHDFERILEFTLTGEQMGIIGESFESKIKERLASESMSYEKAAVGTSTVFSVTMKADSPESLSQLTGAFLDGPDNESNSGFTGGKSKENRLNKIRYEYVDSINFFNFLSGSQATKGLFYRFEYPSSFKAHFSDNNNCENVLEDHNILTCVTYNKVIEVKSYAEKANVAGIMQRVLLFLSLAVMLLVILLNLGGIMRCIKKRQLDAGELELFSRKGYAFLTVFALSGVVFVIALIRLFFGIY